MVKRRDQEFWVTEVNPDGYPADEEVAMSKRIVMTTGSRHQQIYWTPEPDGSLKQFPWVYEIAMARWIPSEHTFLRPEDWTQYDPTWNQDCIRCHSVGPLPNFNPGQGQWNTQVTELGIACAGCHGPGEEHVRAHQNPLQAAAANLAAWREREALRRNRPRQWIMRDPVLLEIAVSQPDTKKKLSATPGLAGRTAARAGDQLLRALADAENEQCDYEPPQKPDERQKAVLKKMQSQVSDAAEELGLATELIAPKKELSSAMLGSRDLRIFRGWRREYVGQRLLEMLESC